MVALSVPSAKISRANVIFMRFTAEHCFGVCKVPIHFKGVFKGGGLLLRMPSFSFLNERNICNISLFYPSLRSNYFSSRRLFLFLI